MLNAKETTLAAQKQQAIREAFKDWIWRDPERRQALVRQYNEEMNSTRPREYDGSHIVFGGMNPSITLREHQKTPSPMCCTAATRCWPMRWVRAKLLKWLGPRWRPNGWAFARNLSLWCRTT